MNARRPVAIIPGAMLAALAFLGATGTASAQEKTVRDLIEKAERGEMSERLDVIRRLGSYTDPRIIDEWKLVDVLLDLVDDGNPRVARAAVQALGNFARGVQKSVGDQIVGPLGKIAKDEDRHPIVRIAAIVELGKVAGAEQFEHKEAIKTLVSIAGNTRQEASMRVEAFVALGKIAPVEAMGVIRKALRDNDPEIHEEAFEALKSCLQGPGGAAFAKDKALGGLIANKLRSPRSTPKIKQLALEILSLLPPLGGSAPQIGSILIKVLREEKDTELVTGALRAAGRVGNVQAASAMVEAYERFRAAEDGGGDAVRTQISKTAGTLFENWSRQKQIARARPAAEALIELLDKALKEDASPAVKRAAAVSLGNLYDKNYDKRKAVMTLILVMGHEEMGAEIKSAALDSLEVLTRKSFGGDTDRWEKWYKKNQRYLAPGRL